MSKIAILLAAPNKTDANAWDPAAWEAAAAHIVELAASMAPEAVYVPHIAGVSLAVAAGLARKGIPVLLLQPYKGRNVVAKDGGKAYKAWDGYWHGPAAEFNTAVKALDGLQVRAFYQGDDVAYGDVDAIREKYAARVAEVADTYIVSAGLGGDNATAAAAVLHRVATGKAAVIAADAAIATPTPRKGRKARA